MCLSIDIFLISSSAFLSKEVLEAWVSEGGGARAS